AGRVACAARIRRISKKGLHAPRVADGTHARLRNRAPRRSHHRGPSRMIEFSARFRRCLAGLALLLVAPWCAAQQSATDVSSLLLGQQGDASTSAVRTAAAEARPMQQDAVPPTDAAALLGTEYLPDEDAMFGAQLFQPGMTKTYGQGFNADYTLAIGDRVA